MVALFKITFRILCHCQTTLNDFSHYSISLFRKLFFQHDGISDLFHGCRPVGSLLEIRAGQDHSSLLLPQKQIANFRNLFAFFRSDYNPCENSHLLKRKWGNHRLYKVLFFNMSPFSNILQLDILILILFLSSWYLNPMLVTFTTPSLSSSSASQYCPIYISIISNILSPYHSLSALCPTFHQLQRYAISIECHRF